MNAKPSDIIALRIECAQCKSVQTISLNQCLQWMNDDNVKRRKTRSPLSDCQVCGHHWATAGNTSIAPAMDTFAKAIADIVATFHAQPTGLGFSLSIEIKEEEPEPLATQTTTA